MHYLNDILCLKIDALNDVLTDHLLNRLLLPLYVYSLTKKNKYSVRVVSHPEFYKFGKLENVIPDVMTVLQIQFKMILYVNMV